MFSSFTRMVDSSTRHRWHLLWNIVLLFDVHTIQEITYLFRCVSYKQNALFFTHILSLEICWLVFCRSIARTILLNDINYSDRNLISFSFWFPFITKSIFIKFTWESNYKTKFLWELINIWNILIWSKLENI